MADYTIEPLTGDHARQILCWRYSAAYDFYNPLDTGEIEDLDVQQLLNPTYNFHAVIDGQHGHCGFCSFGINGQVPGGDYAEVALDVALGMRPALTGQGHGAVFFAAILAFSQSHFCKARLRLTIAQFNQRALSLYQHFGFQETAKFTDARHAIAYTELNLDVNT